MTQPSPRAATPHHGPKDELRQRILEAAERTFAERGYGDTRMQDIAAAARTSLRTVYDVATGKVEIFRMLQEIRMRDLVARIEDALADETADPVETLMDVIAVVASFLMDHVDFLRIHLRQGHAWALDDAEHPIAEARHTSGRLLERLFRRGIRSGRFHRENPKRMVARLRALEQVELAAWVAGRGRLSKRQTTQAIQLQAQRLFCR